jgi:hypothetical protein
MKRVHTLCVAVATCARVGEKGTIDNSFPLFILSNGFPKNLGIQICLNVIRMFSKVNVVNGVLISLK